MNDAIQLFILGSLVGFGLSVFVGLIGSALGNTLALFDSATELGGS